MDTTELNPPSTSHRAIPWMRPILTSATLLIFVWLAIFVMAAVLSLPPDVSWRTRAAMLGQVVGIGMATASAWSTQRRLDREKDARRGAEEFVQANNLVLAKTKRGKIYVQGQVSAFEARQPLFALGLSIVVLAINLVVVFFTDQ